MESYHFLVQCQWNDWLATKELEAFKKGILQVDVIGVGIHSETKNLFTGFVHIRDSHTTDWRARADQRQPKMHTEIMAIKMI
jgi:hypothetical protein